MLVGYLGGLKPVLNTVSLILGRKSMAGSVIGGIAETQEMLDFRGQHGITSDIELIKIQSIDETYERMLKSDVKLPSRRIPRCNPHVPRQQRED